MTSAPSFRLALGLLAAACLALSGCVERTITIGSDPTGALVTLNDVEVGRTPITVPFTWYGDYDIRLRYEKDIGTPENPGVQRYYLHTHKFTNIPWFEIIPFDLAAQLLPVPFKDEQVWAFPVPPVPASTDQEVIGRAQELKSQLDHPPSPTKP